MPGPWGPCGEKPTRPRFDRPSTDRVRPRSALARRARDAGAKNADPSGALNVCSVVPNARPTAPPEPVTRTSSRFAETDDPFSEWLRAQRRTTRTDAAEGAK